jgi:ATP/maltotriose-dependent transcriptional regulator MalT
VKQRDGELKPTRNQLLETGRELLQKRSWSAAFSRLSDADHEAPLEPEDLEELAGAAHLLGKDAENADLLSRAHRGFLERGDTRPAARCALRLGSTLMINGDHSKSGGWLSRAGRLLEEESDCVEKGYLLLPVGFRSFHSGDGATAYAAFVQAAAIGERYHDRDLTTLAMQGQGRALIRQGDICRGVALLDEAMVAVTVGEVSPMAAGGVYCSVIEACGEIYDMNRAHEWTSALEQWCKSQPDIVPYRGHCLVRRAEILQMHGEWTDALAQARQAREVLSQPPPKRAVGAAIYRLAELQRLRGAFAEAEELYRQASERSQAPQPGFALLRLEQGHLEPANAAIRRMAEEIKDGPDRVRILDAFVQIAVAANDIAAARAAANELEEIASRQGAAFLNALSRRAAGAVLLSEGDAGGAVTALRQAWSIWRELGAPYEAAQTRVLLGRAYRKLGDQDAAVIELSAARDAFQNLGAMKDMNRAEGLLIDNPKMLTGPLTARETQVIQLVAEGMTNKGIANTLGVSEKTVARHVSNIFTKLDLTSRAAATAYAFRNKLV